MCKRILNNKKCITCIEVFLVLYIIVAGFFIYKIINDRITYLSRVKTLEEIYIPSESISDSLILKNNKNSRKIPLNKLINKIKLPILISDFDKNINAILLDGKVFVKMYKEFPEINNFGNINKMPELTEPYIKTIDL